MTSHRTFKVSRTPGSRVSGADPHCKSSPTDPPQHRQRAGARELAPRPSRFISLSVALVQAQIEMALASVLAHVPDAEVRLVGTASSMVRGIDLPANDVDVLFRQRADV